MDAEKSALQQNIAETRERMRLLEVEEAEGKQKQKDRFSAPKVRHSHEKLVVNCKTD